MSDPKLQQVVHTDFADLTAIADRLTGYDACLFCLGVSSVGKGEDEYTHVTYDYALAAGRVLAARSPGLRFLYVSGAGTGTGSRQMWARVKGRTENDLIALPSLEAYGLRPGIIQPLHGVTSKTRLYRTIYRVSGFLFPLLRRLAPNKVISSDELAAAMLNVAANGYSPRVLEGADLRAAAGARSADDARSAAARSEVQQ